MCIPQKSITEATILKIQKSFRKKMPIVNGKNMIYGDHAWKNYRAPVKYIQWFWYVCTHSYRHGALVRSKDPCVSMVGKRVACRNNVWLKTRFLCLINDRLGCRNTFERKSLWYNPTDGVKGIWLFLVPALRIRYHVSNVETIARWGFPNDWND